MGRPRFFQGRQRDETVAKLEAEGHDLWTSELSDRVRTRLVYAMRDSLDAYHAPQGPFVSSFLTTQAEMDKAVAKVAVRLVLADEGLAVLPSGDRGSWFDTLTGGVRECEKELVLSLIEAFDLALAGHAQYEGLHDGNQIWRELVNDIFLRGRVAYDFINAHIVPRSSQHMHTDVVKPVLTLLGGRPGWGQVETAWTDALQEDSPRDAITDAATALQQALVVAGCQGNSLGPLITHAKKSGLLAAHDSPLGEGLTKIMHWVSSDRNTFGDGHQVAEPSPEDAWLTIHIVGALILRLAQGPDRGAV